MSNGAREESVISETVGGGLPVHKDSNKRAGKDGK